MPLQPAAIIYEINTWVWLNALSARAGRPLTLAQVPNAELERLARLGVDAVWLMGVWYRSPAGRASALNYIHEYRGALPDIQAEEVVGSAYAIGDYRVDERLGGPQELADLRARLRERGLRLILDYVPNHVALDHPWLAEAPAYFVRADARQAAARPGLFTRVQDGAGQPYFVAHGRDPYFPSWIDTAQVNAYSPAYRAAARETLLGIAAQCDGVRCDMAMLLLNNVFANTWSAYLSEPRPRAEFWPPLIRAVRQQHPDFTFLAEVYWDLEETLLAQGFDLCYHKNLYDRIMHWDRDGLWALLQLRPESQRRLLNFIENHDEPRAMERLGPKRQRLAAAFIATLPAALLLHEGQLEGRRVKLPVQIARQPAEPPNQAIYGFYERLLQERAAPIYRHGEWQLLEAPAPLLCYGWRAGNDWRLVALNFSSSPRKTLVSAPTLGDAAAINALAKTEKRRRVSGGLLALQLGGYEAQIWRPLNSG